jgi:apoptosis-inducing factor 3
MATDEDVTPAAEEPDLLAGVPAEALPEGGMLVGRVGEDQVLAVRVGGAVYAVGAECTHYHGPLAEGVLVGDTVRCPWHHAQFSLRTGEAIGGPAIDPLPCWRAWEREGRVGVEPRAAPERKKAARSDPGPRRIVVVGGGAAGFATAEMLRRQGFTGDLTLLSADADAPYDRPNCSKDYLAGGAPAEWMPLREAAWYGDNGVDLRLSAEVGRLDLAARAASLADGQTVPFDALLIATGAEPRRLPVPGFDGPQVFVLRSLADAGRIIGAASAAGRVAVVGASFIGLEVAAALRARSLEVSIVAPEELPLGAVLGEDLGRFIRGLHERHGVAFHLGRTPMGLDAGRLTLDDGSAIDADIVVVGAGVAPRTGLAEAAGLAVDGGVLVDSRLRASAPGVFAAGDVARYPDPVSGQAIRVEHWVHAERQGQHVARMMLGGDAPFTDPPFFWSVHYDVTINYVGHGQGFERAVLDGAPERGDAEARYEQEGRLVGLATIGRDRRALEAEVELEARSRHGGA